MGEATLVDEGLFPLCSHIGYRLVGVLNGVVVALLLESEPLYSLVTTHGIVGDQDVDMLIVTGMDSMSWRTFHGF
jgi:hypothetical protein